MSGQYSPRAVADLLDRVRGYKQRICATDIVAQTVTALVQGGTLPAADDLERAAVELRELPEGVAVCYEYQENGATVAWDVSPPTADGRGERSRQAGDLTVRLSSRLARGKIQSWTWETLS